MFGALLDFFKGLFKGFLITGNSTLDNVIVSVGGYNDILTYNYNSNGDLISTTTLRGGSLNMPLGDYLALVCSLIALIFIVVLCCLFVFKIIKLIGGLIR